MERTIMNMKIHKGSTACNCVGGANTGCGTLMMCYPVYDDCGCGGGCGNDCGCGGGCGGCGGGGGVGGAVVPPLYNLGAAATTAGSQCLNCGCPISFGGLSYNYGDIVAHSNPSTDFVIKGAGTYRVCWSVTLAGNNCGCEGVGNSYGFTLNGYPECYGEGTEGTEGYNGTVSHCCVLTLPGGAILRLVPTNGCDATIFSATLDITRVDPGYIVPMPF